MLVCVSALRACCGTLAWDGDQEFEKVTLLTRVKGSQGGRDKGWVEVRWGVGAGNIHATSKDMQRKSDYGDRRVFRFRRPFK